MGHVHTALLKVKQEWSDAKGSGWASGAADNKNQAFLLHWRGYTPLKPALDVPRVQSHQLLGCITRRQLWRSQVGKESLFPLGIVCSVQIDEGRWVFLLLVCC